MKRLQTVTTLVALTLLREWKATAALVIALYVAIPLVSFLENPHGSISVDLTGNSGYFGVSLTGRIQVDQ